MKMKVIAKKVYGNAMINAINVKNCMDLIFYELVIVTSQYLQVNVKNRQ